MLAAISVSKSYTRRSWSWTLGNTRVSALTKVDLAVATGSTVMIVGASGSGKSTLARCLSGQEVPDSGRIELNGEALVIPGNPKRRHRRREVQLVFQDAATSFNPSMSVEAILTEPMRIEGRPLEERRSRFAELMDQINLPSSVGCRLANHLSGGERTRVSIARALAVHPRVLILDEVTSGMDLIARHRLLELLRRISVSQRVSLILISHDMRLDPQFIDTIAVMDRGEIVEHRSASEILKNPEHRSTRALIEAIEPLHRRP